MDDAIVHKENSRADRYLLELIREYSQVAGCVGERESERFSMGL